MLNHWHSHGIFLLGIYMNIIKKAVITIYNRIDFLSLVWLGFFVVMFVLTKVPKTDGRALKILFLATIVDLIYRLLLQPAYRSTFTLGDLLKTYRLTIWYSVFTGIVFLSQNWATYSFPGSTVLYGVTYSLFCVFCFDYYIDKEKSYTKLLWILTISGAIFAIVMLVTSPLEMYGRSRFGELTNRYRTWSSWFLSVAFTIRLFMSKTKKDKLLFPLLLLYSVAILGCGGRFSVILVFFGAMMYLLSCLFDQDFIKKIRYAMILVSALTIFCLMIPNLRWAYITRNINGFLSLAKISQITWDKPPENPNEVVQPSEENNVPGESSFPNLPKPEILEGLETEEQVLAEGGFEERFFFIKTAIKLAADRPILGNGPDALRGYLVSEGYWHPAYSHVDFLEVYMSFGFIGLCIYLAPWIKAFFSLFFARREKNGALIFTLYCALLLTSLISVSYYEYLSVLIMCLVLHTLPVEKDISKKRILFMSPVLASGGAERVVSVLASQLAESGYTVGIQLDKRCEKEYSISDKVELRSMPPQPPRTKNYIKKVAKFIKKQYQRLKLIAEFQPHIIISFLQYTTEQTFVNNLFYGARFVSTIRVNPKIMDETVGWLHYHIRNFIALCSNAIFVQNREQKNYFPRFMHKRIFIVPNPINIQMLSESPKKAKNIKKIITAGRLVNQKNQMLLVQAFSKIATDFPEVNLEIYGEGPLMQDLLDQISGLSLSNRAFVMGRSESMHQTYADSDLFVLTSNYEGMPNALLEAMASGLPCISTDCPTGPKDIIIHEENGLLIPVNNVNALQGALTKLLGDIDLANKLAASGHHMCQDQYTPTKIAEEFIDKLAKTVYQL